MDAPDLKHPDLYINRELSLLQFHSRVLAQATDESIPLLERLRFLCISSTNLDEFFEIRVSGLKEQIALGSVQAGPDGLTPHETLKRVSEYAHGMVEEQYRILQETLFPQLEKENIRFLRRQEWTPKQAQWVKRYFNSELLPMLSPLGLDPAHPFPRIINKSLNFIVSLEGKDAFGRENGIAVVMAPRTLPRLIHVPRAYAKGPYEFIFLSSIIHAYVDDLFPGMSATGCYQFRVTRNSDLFVDEEEIDDLLHALEGELSTRRYGDAVRLEVADNCPDEMADFLLKQFNLTLDDLYKVNGPVNLNRLMPLPDLVDRPDLKYPPFTPGLPLRMTRNTDIFEIIQRGDVLLHHPFESFAPVVEFLRKAAADPQVLAIKQTLYRTGPDSVIADALVEAAKTGKEVTAVVELRARFDEEENIHLANRLQDAGAQVVYGVVGYKSHAKVMVVVRREGKRLRRYVHLSTGNYHARTSRIYTDIGLLTCDKDIGDDAHKIFSQLTGLGRARKLKKLWQSPFTLHKQLIGYIDREAEHAKDGKPAHLIAKMNSLTEPQLIQALYRASQAGVKIELIIRGICRLRPGIPNVSDNIQVRSIVGRFLEHSRIYYFLNDGHSEIYCSSADWMERNMFRRVETAFPVEDPRLAERLLKEGLLLYLSDNTQAWILQSDGSYKRLKPTGNQKPRSAQQILLEKRAD
ncbi:Polyphosphate kinase [Nitrosococcus halophilus Nc 4]|uniref:Polyphosphate kinase n=1 Tax=Nitrosococcus halophilus (strain Nc4) TaxID=472759 RepID=D5BV49_NITHN|nr:polyphosphate kinase 1 [Nitrosococcus halophilus]ADE15399.1 Polyphosphate kinase [Nitrosococcus halophilus Nc 4]